MKYKIVCDFGDCKHIHDVVESTTQPVIFSEQKCKKCGRLDSLVCEEIEEVFNVEYVDEYDKPLDDKPGGSTPSQYAIPKGATDLQDLIEHREMNFAQGNIFKASYRGGHCSHSDQLRDARKIKWFNDREIARLERED